MTRDYTATLSRFAQKRARFTSLFLPVILLLMPFSMLAVNQTPLSYFAIYYQNLLEFSTTATMTVNGIVYCNSNIYVGGGGTLTFGHTVAAAGTITAPPNNGSSWGNATNYSSSWNTLFNGSPSNLMRLPPLQLSVPMTNYHDLIDIPVTNDPATPVGRQLLYNQAQIILIVSNAPLSFSNSLVYLKIQKAPTALDVPGADPAPTLAIYTNLFLPPQNTNLPFLTLTNRFYDIREKTTNFVTQIDVAKYKTWLTNGSGPVVGKFPSFGSDTYPTILYVADYRKTNAAHQLMVVRLVNGMSPPMNGGLGFSMATPNPLYVQGNYNCTNPASLGTTNTSTAVPSAFYCDAFTILSSAWSDFNSTHNPFGSGTGWNANDTTINASIVAGIVPSTGTDMLHFSGGVHNFPRLLEDWSGNSLWLNTSLINLYNSTRATGQFLDPGVYYQPPTRKFTYDARYRDPNVAPPGMPTVSTGNPLVFVQPQAGVLPAGNSAHFSFGAAGYGPLTYQWNLNGTNLDGVTNTSFGITNIQAQDAGTYTVTVSDGASTSTNLIANFTVMDIKPIIHPQPVDQAVLAGSNVTFRTFATGTTPINWQWQFNSTNIDGATNATLVLPNVSADQAGVYTVAVTNPIGSSLSSAVLSVYTSAAPAMDSFSLTTNNQIQFTVDGVPGFSYAVQSSTDLVNWDSIATVISPFDFTDTNTANLPQCYYRVIYAP